MTTTALQDQIRKAYNTLPKAAGWVRLSALRPLVGGDREDQNKALLALVRTGNVHLVPDSKRSTLTQADHDAAYRLGTEDKHLIAIDDEDY